MSIEDNTGWFLQLAMSLWYKGPFEFIVVYFSMLSSSQSSTFFPTFHFPCLSIDYLFHSLGSKSAFECVRDNTHLHHFRCIFKSRHFKVPKPISYIYLGPSSASLLLVPAHTHNNLLPMVFQSNWEFKLMLRN